LLQKKRLEITKSHAIEALKGINKKAWTSLFLAGGIKGLCGFIFYVCQSFFILRWSWGVAVHWEWKGGLMNIYRSFLSLTRSIPLTDAIPLIKILRLCWLKCKNDVAYLM